MEILISGSDMFIALKKAKESYGTKRIAVIGSSNMLVGIEQISEAVGISVGQYILNENSLEEVNRNVELAKSDDYEVIVGGTNGSRYAKTLGLDTILIESGRESIGMAIAEAMRIADVSHKERQKSLMYRTIIDTTYEGAMALDLQQRIILLNTAAQKIIGLFPGDYCGKTVDDVLPSSQLATTIKDKDSFNNEILNLDKQYLSVTKLPLILNDEHFGSVITFQDITRIQEMESKIRGKIFSTGHKAKYRFSDIVGTSPKLIETVKTAELYSRNDSNILIMGETGTGKELFAQSIHNASHRQREPFVAVNCAALSESLLESELFGYVEGAFTGALKGGKKGLFELAHNGTIFLDEISEISVSLQGRLLRVIQEQEIRRLGHDRIIPINVRVVSASNRDLKDYIKEGRFREDLYYRLNVFKICTPSLREREEDTIQLADHFIRESCCNKGKAPIRLLEDEIAFMKKYSWPGNIRELRNICERLVALRDSENGLGQNALIHIFSDLNISSENHTADFTGGEEESSLKSAHREQEHELIASLLKKYAYNRTRTAEALGISRVTLWRKMKEYGLAG